MSNPPPKAAGREVKAPTAAAPRANSSSSGPRAAPEAAPLEPNEGLCRMAATADRPPAMPQVMADTLATETPDRRAASGLAAAARIIVPNSV